MQIVMCRLQKRFVSAIYLCQKMYLFDTYRFNSDSGEEIGVDIYVFLTNKVPIEDSCELQF